MSTVDAKPFKGKVLNAKMLTAAAVVLLVLALLFLLTPLLRLNNGVRSNSNFPRTFNGQTFQGRNSVPGQENGTQNPGGTNFPTQQSGTRSSLARLSFLGGMGATIIYTVALLLSLAAAIGMFNVKRWGQVLGIIMAVIYALLAVVSFLPTLLLVRFTGGVNPLSLGMNILHLVLAVTVIILASIPVKRRTVPTSPTIPPPATA